MVTNEIHLVNNQNHFDHRLILHKDDNHYDHLNNKENYDYDIDQQTISKGIIGENEVLIVETLLVSIS